MDGMISVLELQGLETLKNALRAGWKPEKKRSPIRLWGEWYNKDLFNDQAQQ